MSLILRSTSDIVKDIWKKDFSRNQYDSQFLNINEWDYSREMVIADVSLWEQLYYKPGAIGIYVSWSPFAEFYMIVHNLFSHIDQGIETFYGLTAYQEVQLRAASLGAEIKDTRIWTESTPSD